jgi:eukaryotic-like serine/threonine-protein kinase
MSRPQKAVNPDDTPGKKPDSAPPRWSGHPLRILQQLKASRHVDRLKQARNLTPAELAAAQEELLSFGAGSIQPLIECLSHGEARGPAIEVLEKLASKDTLRIYVEALMSRNPAVVSGITKALEKTKALDPHQLLEYLADPSVPKAALDSILTVHFPALDRRRLIDLLPVLGKEGRAVVYRLLERNLDQATVLRLLTLLSHPDWSLRVFGARLLAQSPQRPPIEKLTVLLHDEHKTVRLEAVKALERAKAREAVPALALLLRDPDLKVQTACIDALISVGDVSAVPALLEVLKDESEYARRAAVEVLNQLATTEAIQDLVRALRDEDWWVRVRAADALGALGGEKVADAVVGLLEDGDDFVRRYAVEILNSVPSERAVAPLIAALDDPDWWVRERSIDALGKTRDPRAVEPLMELLQRESALAPLCIRALSEIGDRQALDGLSDLVDSDRSEVRRVAVDALRTFHAANLNPEERALLSQALARAGVSSQHAIPMRIADATKGFGPEAGRTTPTPAPPPSSRAAGGADGPGNTPPPTPAIPSMPDAPAEPGGALKAAIDPVRPARSINFYELAPESLLLNRYRVLRTIGKGGFGVVYLVHDAAIQDEVILKVLNPQLSIDDLAIRRFVRELKLTRRITHKNVIRIHDLLDIGGAKAVSMEYFPGRDLGRILKLESAMPAGRALSIAAQIADGLAAAHTAGVIHRDVKPANVLVGKDDWIKIVDFGLASAQQHIGSRLTKSGLLIGTPEYMAPEQISGNTIDPRTDIYSVGVLLYEMLAGRKAFLGETAVQILFQHLEGTVEPLDKVRPELSPELVALVHQAMARDPAERHQTADELALAIRALIPPVSPDSAPDA